jgi:hypothetical protein
MPCALQLVGESSMSLSSSLPFFVHESTIRKKKDIG